MTNQDLFKLRRTTVDTTDALADAVIATLTASPNAGASTGDPAVDAMRAANQIRYGAAVELKHLVQTALAALANLAEENHPPSYFQNLSNHVQNLTESRGQLVAFDSIARTFGKKATR